MAKRAEPWVSPTKRIPSGPNPSGPADLIWGLPCFKLAVGSPAPAETAIMIAVSAGAGDPTASLKQGNPQIKSAGPLGFGPDGILFVGDTQGSALFAIDTGDRTAAGQ